MKYNKMIIAVFALGFFMISAAFNPASALVADKTFMIYTGHSAAHDNVSGFIGNYSTDNTIINGTDIDFATELDDSVDALFLPGNEGFTTAELTAIGDWFALDGKLLWVAGDSDFGDFFIAADLNPVLKKVGSVLRLDAGAIDDVESSDGSGYRVVSTGVGDGEIATAVTEGMDNVTTIYHGPTSVYYVVGDVRTDLRGADVENVEVITMASPTAKILDQDVTLGDDDFYYSIANDKAEGNYPMLAVEVMGKGMVIVSGEASFTSYKNMYGNFFEKSGNYHVGGELVDNLITYFFEEVNAGFLPVDGLFVVAAIAFSTAVIVRRRK